MSHKNNVDIWILIFNNILLEKNLVKVNKKELLDKYKTFNRNLLLNNL